MPMQKNWEYFYKSRGRYYLVPHSQLTKVVSKFKKYRVSKVLDLGCGSGRNSIYLAREGFNVTGIDFSKEALTLAKKWAKSEKLNIKFDQGDIHKKISYKDGEFDGALGIDSLHYSNTFDLKFTLKEAFRVIKPGGIIYLTFPTQAGNPLISHLVFTEKEIKEIVNEEFRVLESFLDERKFFVCLGQKTNNYLHNF